MAAAAALGLAPAGGAGAAASADLKAAARDAWIYGLPLVEMATTRSRAARGGPTNQLRHARALAGPDSRNVTAPNNDTLYSQAWLDLTKGPVTLTLPQTGDRYISAALMNMYTDHDAILGTRTTGEDGGRFQIVGPGHAGSGPDIVRVSTPQAWLLIRTLASGPDDLPAVHRVQNGMRLEAPGGGQPATFPARQAPALEYFAGVAALLRENPPPPTDRALFERVAPLGLTMAGQFDPDRFDAAQQAAIEAGVAEAKAAVRQGGGAVVAQGWSYPAANLGDFGQDYGFRAAVALAGLAGMPPQEAMYMQPAFERGRMIEGAGPYRLHFPAGRLPPVDAFWSLTMYEATPDGQFFLVDNPLGRYSIGDRTPGLRTNADGSLDIWIARQDPGGAKSANWLPAPAQGPFTLSLRAYLPRRDLIVGRYRLPAIEPA